MRKKQKNKSKKKIERVSNFKAKRLKKKLIESDDETVVEALPKNLDTSNVDIKVIVENMEESENMAEVVLNNMDAIIKQDNVRDTLKYLDDSDVSMVLEEKKEILKRKQKIDNAIEAITNNDKKIKTILDNLKSLTDIELGRVLGGFKPELTEERQEYIERQKIKIVGKKIIRNIGKYGTVLHIGELIYPLADESRELLLDLCLRSIESYQKEHYEKDKVSKFNSNVKTKLTLDLLEAFGWDELTKQNILNKYKEKGLLSSSESKSVWDKMQKIRMEKEGKKQEGQSWETR